MEVIAATASFLTIVETIAKLPAIVEALRGFVHTNIEVQALINELSTLLAMQAYVQDTVSLVSNESDSPSLAIPEPEFLKTTRHEMRDLLKELQDLIIGLTDPVSTANFVPRRMRFLSQKRKINQLVERLKAVRSQIHLALSSLSLNSQHNQGRLLLEVRSITTSAAGDVRSGFNELRDLLDSLPTVVNQTTYNLQVTNYQNNNQDQPQDEEVATSGNQQKVPGSDSSQKQGTPSNRKAKNDFVHLLTSLRRKRCKSSCMCQCHSTRTSTRSPAWLKPVLGNLFVNYGCLPVLGRHKCDQLRCANASISEVAFDYYFPTWLWNRALSFTMLMGHVLDEGTSLHIYCPRVLPDGGVFRAVEDGNLGAVKNGFSRFVYSPQDVNPLGKSLLFVALDWGNYDVANFLVQEWNLKNASKHDRLSTMRARERLLSFDEKIDTSTKKVLRHVAFSKDDSDSDDSISSKMNYQREQGTDVSKQINKRDFLERTPLIQASTNGDLATVKALVEAGAPLDATDWLGRTALMTAVYYKHYECASVLIDAGCDVDAQNMFKWSAILYAIPHADLPIIKSLTKGKNLQNCKGHTDFTPIHEMTRRVFGPEDVARECLVMLLEARSPIDAPNVFGDSPILHAVSKNNSLMVRLLIEFEARLDLLNNDGQNVLHMAALFGNFDTIQALWEADIPATYWNQADKHANTPVQYWLRRTKNTGNTSGSFAPAGLETIAFEKLLTLVRNKGVKKELRDLGNIETALTRRNKSRAVAETTKLRETKDNATENKVDVETLRVLGIQIKEEMWDAAEETVRELLELRQEMLNTSPFDQAPKQQEVVPLEYQVES